MASRNFPRKVNTQKVINSLLKKCVDLGFDTTDEYCEEMRNWCTSNIGPRRQNHPIHEVYAGWVTPESVEINWAWGIVDQKFNFWFNRPEDKISFVLTFK